jgi:hypothetical protein
MTKTPEAVDQRIIALDLPEFRNGVDEQAT